MDLVVNAAVGVLAVFATLLVLYITRLRPARLRLAAPPGSYRTTFEQHRLLLRFPIVVANSGGKHGVVTGLRFKIPAIWNGKDEYAFTHRSYDTMDRDDPSSRRFFEPIAVAGGAAELAICEFILVQVNAEHVVTGDYIITLEMPYMRRDQVRWEALGKFMLHVTEVERYGFDRPMTHFNGFRSESAVAKEAAQLGNRD